MDQKQHDDKPESSVTIEDVNRVLDVGRLLLAVLTEAELAELAEICSDDVFATKDAENAA